MFSDKELDAYRDAHANKFAAADEKKPAAVSTFRSPPSEKRVSFGSVRSPSGDEETNNEDEKSTGSYDDGTSSLSARLAKVTLQGSKSVGKSIIKMTATQNEIGNVLVSELEGGFLQVVVAVDANFKYIIEDHDFDIDGKGIWIETRIHKTWTSATTLLRSQRFDRQNANISILQNTIDRLIPKTHRGPLLKKKSIVRFTDQVKKKSTTRIYARLLRST